MAIRNIRENGDEILRKKAKKVPLESITEEKIQTLIEDMIDTLHAMNGVGLAAQQVGILKQIIVIDLYDDTGVKVFINPIIKKTKGEHEVDEGCLSFPNQFATVIRPKEVEIEAWDREGKKIKVKTKDSLFAQAICHETDHLNGELFVDKMLPGTLHIVKQEEK